MWFCPNVCNLLYFRYQISISVYVIPVVYGMIGIARTGSVYLTMSVTLERYFAIVRPLASFRIKRCLIPISITFAGLYNIPRFFELERYNFTYTNETLVRATKLRENPLYVSIYNTWMKMVSIKWDFLKDFSTLWSSSPSESSLSVSCHNEIKQLWFPTCWVHLLNDATDCFLLNDGCPRSGVWPSTQLIIWWPQDFTTARWTTGRFP